MDDVQDAQVSCEAGMPGTPGVSAENASVHGCTLLGQRRSSCREQFSANHIHR